MFKFIIFLGRISILPLLSQSTHVMDEKEGRVTFKRLKTEESDVVSSSMKIRG